MSATTNPLLQPTLDNNFSELEKLLAYPGNSKYLLEKINGKYLLQLAAETHNCLLYVAVLNAILALQNPKPVSIISLFYTPPSITITSEKLAAVINASGNDLLTTLKSFEQIDPEGAISGMIKAITNCSLLDPQIKEAFTQEKTIRQTTYGHSDSLKARSQIASGGTSTPMSDAFEQTNTTTAMEKEDLPSFALSYLQQQIDN